MLFKFYVYAVITVEANWDVPAAFYFSDSWIWTITSIKKVFSCDLKQMSFHLRVHLVGGSEGEVCFGAEIRGISGTWVRILFHVRKHAALFATSDVKDCVLNHMMLGNLLRNPFGLYTQVLSHIKVFIEGIFLSKDFSKRVNL